MATIIRKISGGITGKPFNSVADEIAKVGGVEDEFLFEGSATQFELRGGSREYSADGRWQIDANTKQDFRSRMLVLRPGDPGAFNGSVFVVWNNVSAGQDTFTVPGIPAAQLIEDGFALVGVSVQRISSIGAAEAFEDFGIDIKCPPGLREYDPQRYGTLELPGDGFSYDIYTQAAQLVGRDRTGGIDAMTGLEVKHVVSMGGSQSAHRVATYINAIQPVTSLFDGFFLLGYGGAGCSLDPPSAPRELPEIPTNTMQFLPWRSHRVRDDLEIPIIILNSEFEAEHCHPNTQPDTEYLRWWEVPGTGHTGPLPAEVLAAMGMSSNVSTVSYGPVVRAVFHALRAWLDGGDPPPHQPRLLKEGNPPALPRDEHGNATGGIRWPDLAVPLGTHVGQRPPDNAERTIASTSYPPGGGMSTPFTPEKVRALYPDHAAWFAQYQAATQRLVDTKVVLPDDAAQMLARALTQELPD